jgi:hypothetical protein
VGRCAGFASKYNTGVVIDKNNNTMCQEDALRPA